MAEMDDPSGSEHVQEVMARVQEHHAKLQEMRKEYLATTAEVTTKDRMVTAKVGAQGQVVSLTFHTTAYQAMAPAQLATVLTDLLNEARAKVGEKLTKPTERLDGVQDLLRLSVPGGAELHALLEPLRSMRPGYAEAEAKKNRNKKQEEFNG
ncbi:YbaB/EbfC family nucleoid-associated protein [Kitasatospora sp. GAS1066B]|uniref:YbaB/EbfC family nucleoid-associated protein n=1 Tax=Kitasatospora sp. GAS1066B TaxID=3156271 RepID=UPI0035194E44